jgi:hypothetical protein
MGGFLSNGRAIFLVMVVAWFLGRLADELS